MYDQIFKAVFLTFCQLILGFIETESRLCAVIEAKSMGANAIVGYRVIVDSEQSYLHYGTAVFYTRK